MAQVYHLLEVQAAGNQEEVDPSDWMPGSKQEAEGMKETGSTKVFWEGSDILRLSPKEVQLKWFGVGSSGPEVATRREDDTWLCAQHTKH